MNLTFSYDFINIPHLHKYVRLLFLVVFINQYKNFYTIHQLFLCIFKDIRDREKIRHFNVKSCFKNV